MEHGEHSLILRRRMEIWTPNGEFLEVCTLSGVWKGSQKETRPFWAQTLDLPLGREGAESAKRNPPKKTRPEGSWTFQWKPRPLHCPPRRLGAGLKAWRFEGPNSLGSLSGRGRKNSARLPAHSGPAAVSPAFRAHQDHIPVLGLAPVPRLAAKKRAERRRDSRLKQRGDEHMAVVKTGLGSPKIGGWVTSPPIL